MANIYVGDYLSLLPTKEQLTRDSDKAVCKTVCSKCIKTILTPFCPECGGKAIEIVERTHEVTLSGLWYQLRDILPEEHQDDFFYLSVDTGFDYCVIGLNKRNSNCKVYSSYDSTLVHELPEKGNLYNWKVLTTLLDKEGIAYELKHGVVVFDYN